VRGVALEHPIADLALRILDQQPPLRSFEEHDEADDEDRDDDHRDDDSGRKRPGPSQFERSRDGLRQARHDAREDDQGDTVADTARRDLLAKPHQEHRSAEKRDDGGDAEEPARIRHDTVAGFQPDGNAVGLHGAEQHGAIARVLVDDLAALLAFLLQLLQRGHDGGHELDDDRGGNVGHDAEREDRHAFDGAAREHVEHAQDTAALLAEGARERIGVQARKRNIGAEPVDDERPEREPDAFLEILGFRKG